MFLALASLFTILIEIFDLIEARFCEGGHICSLPRECCTQGCCPPYQSGPRQLPPPSEHVLNLFFISHWFFWCVVLAIILAILCAYSLWKKRRTLCGWGFNEHHTQSEGDSAGSCYAPPQYSRCSSFHHPPPPYTEVTSKPDLYPLVFTCNSDNGKTGSSYLMVQYFRNYIVRPAGSLSAASTVDSLSSSFICNINEANTLVPPPYSRAASPEIGFSPHFQQQYVMPRSASQLVCQNVNTGLLVSSGTGGNVHSNSIVNGQFDLNSSSNINEHIYGRRGAHYSQVTCQINTPDLGRLSGVNSTANDRTASYRDYEVPYDNGNCGLEERSNDEEVNANVITNNSSNSDLRAQPNSSGFVQSQSDQHFRVITNSNSSISDIFVNNSCAAGIGGENVNSRQHRSENSSVSEAISGAGSIIHPQVGGTPVIFSNGCIKPNPLHRVSTNPTHFQVDSSSTRQPVIYNSNNSIGGISVTVPNSFEIETSMMRNDNELRDLQFLRRSLETCCQLLQQQQKMPSSNFAVCDSPLRMIDASKKYPDDGLLRSYVTSGTCSGVSSLANVGTPSSPPQATSPTGEVKEILDQIRQLQEGVTKYEEDLVFRTSTRPTLHHTMSSPSQVATKCTSPTLGEKLQSISTMSEQANIIEISKSNCTSDSLSNNSLQSVPSTTSVILGPQKSKITKSSSNSTSISTGFTFMPTSKRPSTLQQSKKRFSTSRPPSKALYIPMMASTQIPASSRSTILKSPVTSVVNSNFFNRSSRSRKGWISRSAPTTPATPLPPSYIGDDSPLLNDHDEDPEGEQSAEMDN